MRATKGRMPMPPPIYICPVRRAIKIEATLGSFDFHDITQFQVGCQGLGVIAQGLEQEKELAVNLPR